MKIIKTKMPFYRFILVALMLADSVGYAQCGNHSDNESEAGHNMTDTTSYYSCSMHPEIQASFPVTCPKCGMELIKTPAKEKSNKKKMGMMGMGAMGVMMVVMMAFMIAGGTVYIMSR